MAGSRRTGIAHLPLHPGKAPRWLFQRMVKLSHEIVIAIVSEFGADEMLKRLSDPFWFQSLSCVLGWDWHSSGTTTVVCGAIKESIKDINHELGLYAAGGKGGTSRKTPAEVTKVGDDTGLDAEPLVYASKMSAKVDNTAVQDGYQLYHHSFFFTDKGQWAVVQQGMNNVNNYARRYHWLGETVQDYVCEPHAGICTQVRGQTLNLVAQQSEKARGVVTRLAAEKSPDKMLAEIKHLQSCDLPARHQIVARDIHPDRLYKTFVSTYELKAPDFESLLAIPGVGPKTIRALSLLSELLYGTAPSMSDPARFSFAHGGKDGIPYPVDRPTYDKTIDVLKNAVRKAKLGIREEMEALRRLHRVFDRDYQGTLVK
ncbi:MAG: DUF763 domain-containing protein [Chloroflexi bacterium]|jgi:uncharacterized protein|nr:DUF763 domain-containing protein [Chloroflexota bacterium]MBT7081223.1 DUF763 domain-containing protein [Chloroflexota bacterium]MBT7290114.1 DUF763 domain-containing protein [Chloroflexota bacterium]